MTQKSKVEQDRDDVVRMLLADKVRSTYEANYKAVVALRDYDRRKRNEES